MKKCTRYDSTQLLKDYLHGNVSSTKNQIELHLKSCETCTEKVERLNRGDYFAQMISQTADVPDGWKRLEQKLKDRSGSRWRGRRRIASIAAMVVFSAGALYLLLARSDSTGSFPRSDRAFKEVQLSRFAENTEPHIVTEGVVSAIAIDNQDGDYRIRLQEDLRQAGPFVICEILRPSKIHVPQVGERVRVYGVSRFDSKPGHGWHEVHPVLDIQTVQ